MGGKSYLKSDLREKYRISGGGFIDSEELKGCFVAKLHLSQFMCFFPIPRKVWTLTKILSHNICYFVAIFTVFMVTVEKIITNALGEHDPGAAQNWRTSREMWSPA